MSHPVRSRSTAEAGEDLKARSQRPRPSLVREFLAFLVEEKRWWLVPLCLVLLVLGGLVVLSGTGAGAFLYALF